MEITRYMGNDFELSGFRDTLFIIEVLVTDPIQIPEAIQCLTGYVDKDGIPMQKRLWEGFKLDQHRWRISVRYMLTPLEIIDMSYERS